MKYKTTVARPKTEYEELMGIISFDDIQHIETINGKITVLETKKTLTATEKTTIESKIGRVLENG